MKKLLIILLFSSVCFGANKLHIQNDWSAGKLSETMKPREDLKKFHSGASELENFFPLPQGPVEKRPGTKYVEINDGNVIGQVYYTFDICDIISVPFSAAGGTRVWKKAEGAYTLYKSITDPPYVSYPRFIHKGFDNYIYTGGGNSGEPDNKAKPTKIDSDYNAVSGWPAYDDWWTGAYAIVWGVIPTWDGEYVYVWDNYVDPGVYKRITKLVADTGALVWRKTTTHLGGTFGDGISAVDENGRIFIPVYRSRPFWGDYSPAVWDENGDLLIDYFMADGSNANSTAVSLGCFRADNKWFTFGQAMGAGAPTFGCGILQCFNDDGKVWDLAPWGKYQSTGWGKGAVYYDGYIYLATSNVDYDGETGTNCYKVDASDGSIVAHAQIGTLGEEGRDVVRTSAGQLIFCTAYQFIEIDTDLNVLNTYDIDGYIEEAECTPDWYDYWTTQTYSALVEADANNPERLIPFEYSTEQSYVVAFGNGFIGFFKP